MLVPPSSILLFLLSQSLRTCNSFTTNPLFTTTSTTQRTVQYDLTSKQTSNRLLLFNTNTNDDNDLSSSITKSSLSSSFNDGESTSAATPSDDQRRKLLKSFIASSSLSTIAAIITNTNNDQNVAYAADTDLLDIDQQKVVMQVSAKNLPEKYRGSISNIEDEERWMTDVERKRIDIFEKAAPSVVYIDTYIESRDAFSTNV